MKNSLEIFRNKDNGVQTFSEGFVMGNKRTLFRCAFLELPWKNNERNISCIKPGTYDAVKCPPSKSFKYWHFLLLNVPGRSAIKIHGANHYHQLRGCLAPGQKFVADFDNDGQMDVTHSKATISRLLNFLPQKFTVIIHGVGQDKPIEILKPKLASVPIVPVKKTPKAKPLPPKKEKAAKIPRKRKSKSKKNAS